MLYEHEADRVALVTQNRLSYQPVSYPYGMSRFDTIVLSDSVRSALQRTNELTEAWSGLKNDSY